MNGLIDSVFGQPAYAAAAILVAVVSAFGLSRLLNRRKTVFVKCGDGEYEIPPHSAIAHSLRQVYWRVIDAALIDLDGILLHTPPEQRFGSIGGMQLLEHLQNADSIKGWLICPYPFSVAAAVAKNPRLYPERWKLYRVWFFVPFWVDEPDSIGPDGKKQIGAKGLYVYGIDYRRGRPELIRRSLADNFGPNDAVAVRLVAMPSTAIEAVPVKAAAAR